MAEYKAALEMDENSKEAREGRDKAEKLYKRSKEIDYYKILNGNLPTRTLEPITSAPAASDSPRLEPHRGQ